MIWQYVRFQILKCGLYQGYVLRGWIIIETHEFRSLVENVFVFICYSTWWRTCSRSLPLSLISLITRLRGSKSTPNNFQAPINHIWLCNLASLVTASVSTKSLRWKRSLIRGKWKTRMPRPGSRRRGRWWWNCQEAFSWYWSVDGHLRLPTVDDVGQDGLHHLVVVGVGVVKVKRAFHLLEFHSIASLSKRTRDFFDILYFSIE